MSQSISDLRRDYSMESLLESDAAADPVEQFEKWWQQVLKSQVVEPNAMTLATASQDGVPSARIVLLKQLDKRGFVFYTNYESFKGKQLEENPKACLVFFWKELERQVRITGLVQKIAPQESDAYYLSRPTASQVGAWASPQSMVIGSRDWLDEQYLQKLQEFKEKQIMRPPHWGGFRVQPVIVEFWQGRPSRMHDRLQYSLKEDGNWLIERLAP